jgi:hypothetical protein
MTGGRRPHFLSQAPREDAQARTITVDAAQQAMKKAGLL